MRVYSCITRGNWHPDFCEDFLVHVDLGKQCHICAVFDGCSSGRESHFASAMMGKIMRVAAKMLASHPDFELILQEGAKNTARWLLKRVMDELKAMRNQLLLAQEELLSTIILMIYVKNQCCIIALGDGFIAIDGRIIEIDQENHPDYPVYHIEEDFNEWFEQLAHVFVVHNPQDVSIATDGVATFEPVTNDAEAHLSPLDYLLVDFQLARDPDMLSKKLKKLSKDDGFEPGDDVSIIRMRV